MKNNLAISLLLAGSTNAVAAPTRKTYTTANRFPKWNFADADMNPLDNTNKMQGWDQTNYQNNQLLEAAVKNSTGTKYNAGLYGLFRFSAQIAVTPTQNIDAGTGTPDDNIGASPSSIVVMTQGKTFYETSSANNGSYQDMTVAAVQNVAFGTTITEREKNKGLRHGACVEARLLDAASTYLECPQIVTAVLLNNSAGGNANTTAAYSYIPNRMVLLSEKATDDQTSQDPLGVALSGAQLGLYTNGGAAAQGTKPALHGDIILGTFYQSNGDATDGSTWCNNGEGTNKTYFMVDLPSDGTNKTLTAQEGFGPKTKCTWQVLSPDSEKLPVLQMTQTKSKLALFQVIEWYDYANFKAEMIINKTTAVASPSQIATANTDYAETNGIFFNPIKGTQALTNTIAQIASFPWGVNQPNAIDDIADSIGKVLYYDRSTGQSRDEKREVDSSWVIAGLAGYNAAIAKYDAAVSTYEDNKKAYEADPATKDKPAFLPWTLDSFSGVTFNECITEALEADLTKCADTIWTTNMIGSGTAKDSKAAFPVTSEQSAASATYVQNDVKLNNANRLTYIQLSKATTGDYALTTDYATHTFGRLGQSMDTGLTGKPYLLDKKGAAATVKAGFQISLFPELEDDGTKYVFGDWAITSTTRPTIETKAVAANTSDLVAKTAAASPTAISTVTQGAQALAVSIIATATIAATLF